MCIYICIDIAIAYSYLGSYSTVSLAYNVPIDRTNISKYTYIYIYIQTFINYNIILYIAIAEIYRSREREIHNIYIYT